MVEWLPPASLLSGLEALPKRSETFWVAFVSLLFTYAFFFEYIPPFKIAHIPYDLDGYHYPLLDYAFRSLRQGLLPLWDAAIYCGITMIGNPQVGLFYPPTWILFAVNAGNERLQYWTVEVFMILHVWFGFVLCYLWLRWRGLAQLACTFGAAIFAFSGYMLLQLQHYGLVAGYAWMPLGLWGIDDVAASRDWRALWKLALASAMCCVAGYTPTWFVFWVIMTAYALGSKNRIRTVLMTVGALILSALLVLVQILPALEAASMKTHEVKYGTGIKDLEFYLSYFVPNYFDFGMEVTTHKYGEYLYLGAPAFFGLACWLIWRRFRETVPALLMFAVALIIVTNPFALVWDVIQHSSMISELCRDWYFLAGVTLAIVPIAATGLDAFLTRKSGGAPRWMTPISIAAMGAWSVWLIAIWWRGGAEFSAGWRSAVYPAVFLVLFAAGLLLLVRETGRRSIWLCAALILAVGVDYKAFGTSKRFNARWGKYDREFTSPFVGLDDAVYAEIRRHPELRLVVDDLGPAPSLMRHYGVRTPQGFDPMLPAEYSERLEDFLRPSDHRMLDFDAECEDVLRMLGVGYFITSDGAVNYKLLGASSRWKLMEPSTSYFKAYELRDAQRSYYWAPSARTIETTAQHTVWEPAAREFVVRSPNGGRFVLAEQFFPGWRASVDGTKTTIERYEGAFQWIEVPPGEHKVRFNFRPSTLIPGALISFANLIVLCFVAISNSRRSGA